MPLCCFSELKCPRGGVICPILKLHMPPRFMQISTILHGEYRSQAKQSSFLSRAFHSFSSTSVVQNRECFLELLLPTFTAGCYSASPPPTHIASSLTVCNSVEGTEADFLPQGAQSSLAPGHAACSPTQ